MSSSPPLGKLLITDDCLRCQLCSESCPFQAMTLKQGQLVVGIECQLCLSCLEVCPADAIYYFRKE